MAGRTSRFGARRFAARLHIVPLLAMIGPPAWLGGAARIGAEVPPPSQPASACALLTQWQVSEAMKMQVDPGIREDTGRLDGDAYQGAYSSTCVWKAAGDRDAHDLTRPLGGASFAILTVISWPVGVKGAEIFLQSFRDAAQSHIIANAPVPLQIGDEALWWGDGVAVRKHNHSFGISVHLVNGRSKERQLEEFLAAKVISSL
jgi:hypothetical protein